MFVEIHEKSRNEGGPILSSQLQVRSLRYFESHFQITEKTLSSRLYKSVLLQYLVMVLTMKQTALGLLPEAEGTDNFF